MSERENGQTACERASDGAAYLLSALEDHEVDAFLAHAANCAACRDELAELEVVATALASAAPQVVPPPELKRRIMSVVESEADLLRAAGSGADRPAAARRAWRLRFGWRPMVALAAVALLLAGLAIGDLALGGGGQPATHVTAARVVATPGASAVLRQYGGRTELDVRHFPQPPRGRVYQVWLSRGGPSPQPTNALFTVTSAGSGSVVVPGDLRGVKQVMVTDEPFGGSKRPTRAPRIVAKPAAAERGAASPPARPAGDNPGGSVIVAMATCYRHPSRQTGVSCSSCGRPICTDCMTPTSVGMRCPECARQRTTVHTLRRSATQPVVTYALIAINVIIFLASGSFSVGGAPGGGSYLLSHGELVGSAIANQHEYWRLVSSGFLHANLLHIGFNMYLLYILGMMLEPALGSVKFAAIYFTSLLAGSFGELLLQPHVNAIGASGAVFGLLGAAAVEMRARGINVMQSGIGFLIVINLVISFTLPGIAYGGHIGGLIGGALAALAIQFGDRYRSTALALGLCVVIAGASVTGAVVRAKNTTQAISQPATGLPGGVPGQ